jgi:hypothetical protein
LLNVCFAPDSGRAADIPGSPLSARSGREPPGANKQAALAQG